MKIVKVTYTAVSEYVGENQENIRKVMADLQKLGRSGIMYIVCLGADGKTFIHTGFYETEEDHKMFLSQPSFKFFQEELKAHGLEVPPKQEFLTLVGSSKALF